MTVAGLAQSRPDPIPEPVWNPVEVRVREEIPYREALALGLDTDDTRRDAQDVRTAPSRKSA